MPIKLLVHEWFKTYSVMQVTDECFKTSPQIESVGTMSAAFKIKDEADLIFRLAYLMSLGFIETD